MLTHLHRSRAPCSMNPPQRLQHQRWEQQPRQRCRTPTTPGLSTPQLTAASTSSTPPCPSTPPPTR